jgi:hypothetical protein
VVCFAIYNLLLKLITWFLGERINMLKWVTWSFACIVWL